MSESIRTYQTRPELIEGQADLLDAYASLYGRVDRTLFARIQAGEGLNALKRDFQKRFGITARRFNAVHAGLHGKSKSIKERQPELIDSLQDGSGGGRDERGSGDALTCP